MYPLDCIVGAVKVNVKIKWCTGEGKDIENISMLDAKSINIQHSTQIYNSYFRVGYVINIYILLLVLTVLFTWNNIVAICFC